MSIVIKFCIVCEMVIEEEEGKSGFCSQKCADQFEEEPKPKPEPIMGPRMLKAWRRLTTRGGE